MPTSVCCAVRFGSKTKSPYGEKGEKLECLADPPPYVGKTDVSVYERVLSVSIFGTRHASEDQQEN